MPEPRSFQQVLAAAIADLVEHGFDSLDRVARWSHELRQAAERSLASTAEMDLMLRDALAAIYRRMIDRGQILKTNPGVERFTLDRVRPALRAELDRRIVAAANLIKLNRREAIDQTIRRFEGWSTSIPNGGTGAANRGKARREIRKSVAGLPFTERRVLIDQGHKLTASLNEILATDGGAIAGRWSSRWRQPGYNYREDHKERDREVYLVRDSWAHKAGFVKPGRAGCYDKITAAGQEPFCRCSVVWLYNLRDVPREMLTEKGKVALASVQGIEEVMSARTARADASDLSQQRRRQKRDLNELESNRHVLTPQEYTALKEEIDLKRRHEHGSITKEEFEVELKKLWNGRADTELRKEKAEVDYRGPFMERPNFQRCDDCTMFRRPGSCSAVSGLIDPGGWCKLFERVVEVSHAR